LHPANTSRTTDQGDGLALVMDGSYYEHRQTREQTMRNGLSMVFASYRRPPSACTRALKEARLLIEAIREPTATRTDGTAHLLPWHLWIKAPRPAVARVASRATDMPAW
jgi:hypothetical protein